MNNNDAEYYDRIFDNNVKLYMKSLKRSHRKILISYSNIKKIFKKVKDEMDNQAIKMDMKLTNHTLWSYVVQ